MDPAALRIHCPAAMTAVRQARIARQREHRRQEMIETAGLFCGMVAALVLVCFWVWRFWGN